jgi:aryl-alcohol dehydrogenase-like predicted oxidoreductase
MAAGFLSGKYKKDEKPLEGVRFSLAHLGYRYNQPYWNDASFMAVEKLNQIAEEHGIRLPDFALAWVLSNRTITSIVCGATTVEQLEQNMGAVEITLPKEALDACDAVWRELRPPRLFYGR